MAVMTNSRPVIPVRNLLLDIRHYLSMALQWSEIKEAVYIETVTSNLHKAEALIETIEVFDCGSIGGFGVNQPIDQTLFERWVWLYLKYVGDPRHKRRDDQYDFDELKKFYDRN